MNANMNDPCIACKSKYYRVVFNEFGIDIVQCKCCGHLFSTFPGDQNYNGYFGEQQIESCKQFWWDDAHRDMYADFYRRFINKKTGTLLDVGCGLGYFVKNMSVIPCWEVYGCEISRVAVAYARNKLGLKNIYEGKIEEIDFGCRTFDIITLWDVIEHIPNPYPLLVRIYSLLKQGGMLFLHTPNARIQLPKARMKQLIMRRNPHAHFLEAKDHMNIYTDKSISAVLGRSGYISVQFLHLKPLQSVAGSRNALFVIIKNLWASLSRIIYVLSKRRINIGNLFVVAYKQ